MDTNANDLQTDACPSPPRDQPKRAPKPKAQQVPEDFEDFESTKKKSPYTSKTKCQNAIYINKSKGIHIGPSLTYTVNTGGGKHESMEQNQSSFQLTDKIRHLLQSTERLQRDHLIMLSGHISTSSWKLLARKLGYSEGQIEHFFTDHHIYGVKEVIYQCLLDWIQDKPSQALMGNLITILWNCNEREAVDIFSHHIIPDQ